MGFGHVSVGLDGFEDVLDGVSVDVLVLNCFLSSLSQSEDGDVAVGLEEKLEDVRDGGSDDTSDPVCFRQEDGREKSRLELVQNGSLQEVGFEEV